MWKRRVGVTARLRQIGGNQVTGSPQIAFEIAAPPELRTPMGTAASSCIRVRMEAWRQWRWSQSTENNPRSGEERSGRRGGSAGGTARLSARMRRCLILRQGARPLRPPPPFPLESMFQNGRNRSRVRKPRTNRAPLTDSFRSEDLTEMRERGHLARGQPSCRLPLVGPNHFPKFRPQEKTT
jgi:hypothetical protein